MTLTEKVKQKIDYHQKLTGGMSGLNPAVLRDELDISYKELKEVLNSLHKEGYFIVRPGVHGSLIFLIIW